MGRGEARAALLRMLGEDPVPFPLDRAALLLACEEYPLLDPAPYEEVLDHYADRTSARAGSEGDPRRRLSALRQVLFEEHGFHGNRDDYYDIRNSYLNEVLTRKLGIPISLGTVVYGVGRRLEWPLEPVNFPAHFLLRYHSPGELLAVDPFHGALILGEDELRERWRATTGLECPDVERMLVPAGPREVLLRMLNNIRMIHYRERRYSRAAAAGAWMAAIQPEDPRHLRETGYLYILGSEPERAVDYLEQYLARAPAAPEADTVREHLARIRRGGPELDLPPYFS